MMRALPLAGALFLFWLALSGHYTVFLTTIGAVSSFLTALFFVRVNGRAKSVVSLTLIWRFATYLPWISLEIIKSAIDVAKVILSFDGKIEPTMIEVTADLRTTTGIVTYGNSITLTPGTTTCFVKGNVLTVYALRNDAAVDVEGGAMMRRVRQFEGGL